jgi:hypothetical protein
VTDRIVLDGREDVIREGVDEKRGSSLIHDSLKVYMDGSSDPLRQMSTTGREKGKK